MQPRLWILAGPNGSGKSTFAQRDIFDRLSKTPEDAIALTRINPDEIARRLAAEEPGLVGDALALAAAQQSDAEIDRLIEADASILIETVLSSDKLLARVERALARKYRVGLIYVLLRHPDLNVGRVALRASQGGHSVPEDRIRARWVRSLERLPIFAARAHVYSVWDNSYWGEPPELLIERVGRVPYVSDACWSLLDDTETQQSLASALRTLTEQARPAFH